MAETQQQPSPESAAQNEKEEAKKRHLERIQPLVDSGIEERTFVALDDLRTAHTNDLREITNNLGAQHMGSLGESPVSDSPEYRKFVEDAREYTKQFLNRESSRGYINLLAQEKLKERVAELMATHFKLDPYRPNENLALKNALLEIAELSDEEWFGDYDEASNQPLFNGARDVLEQEVTGHSHTAAGAPNQSNPSTPASPATPTPPGAPATQVGSLNAGSAVQVQSPATGAVGQPASTPPLTGPNTKTGAQTEAERLKQLENEVRHAQELKRRSAVAREGASFSQRRELDNLHSQDLVQYGARFQELLEATVQGMRARGETDEDIKDEIARLTNELEGDEAEIERTMLVDQGGLMARLSERYANLGRKKKIAIGIGIGALIGAGAVLTVGVGGAVAGAFVATRMARGWFTTSAEIYAQQGDTPQYQTDKQRTVEEEIAEAEQFIRGNSVERIKGVDKIRTKALIVGIGSVAAGAMAAELLSSSGVIDRIQGWVGSGWNAASEFARDVNPFGGGEVDASSGGNSAAGGEAPSTPTPGEQLHQFAEGNPKLEALLNSHTDAAGNVNIDIKSGDGFNRLADRYDLSPSQLEALKEIAKSHEGQTYTMPSGDLRLNKVDIKLTPAEALKIFGAK